MDAVGIHYSFRFTDGRQKAYYVLLQGHTLELQQEGLPSPLPSWARLDFFPCPNCPLDPARHSHCPAAVALIPVVTTCGDLASYDEMEIRMTTSERVIAKQTTAQRGISSLMGLLMATSGCPHTRFLKPMARFHLPLASAEETIYRAASMYLLAQYFAHREGGEADLDLEGLKQRYKELNVVNNAMAVRLRGASERDSTVNALVLLDQFTTEIPGAVSDSLAKIRYLFADMLD